MNHDSKFERSNYLSQYHAWLRLMARLQLDPAWDRKFDASDVVQQTLLEAWNGESQFRGDSDGERIAWLRTILGRVISREVRKYKDNQKRDVNQEVALQQSLGQSSMMLGNMIAAESETPSVHAENREQQTIIAEVLETMAEDHRKVIVLRNLKGMPHAEIASILGRSESAVRMLWLRALKELQAGVLARQ